MRCVCCQLPWFFNDNLFFLEDNRDNSDNGKNGRNGIYHVRGIVWKAILSEAVVTEGEALGNTKTNNCLEDSTLSCNDDYQSTVFQTAAL